MKRSILLVIVCFDGLGCQGNIPACLPMAFKLVKQKKCDISKKIDIIKKKFFTI